MPSSLDCFQTHAMVDFDLYFSHPFLAGSLILFFTRHFPFFYFNSFYKNSKLSPAINVISLISSLLLFSYIIITIFWGVWFFFFFFLCIIWMTLSSTIFLFTPDTFNNPIKSPSWISLQDCYLSADDFKVGMVIWVLRSNSWTLPSCSMKQQGRAFFGMWWSLLAALTFAFGHINRTHPGKNPSSSHDRSFFPFCLCRIGIGIT